jgi:hypothetical protein
MFEIASANGVPALLFHGDSQRSTTPYAGDAIIHNDKAGQDFGPALITAGCRCRNRGSMANMASISDL